MVALLFQILLSIAIFPPASWAQGLPLEQMAVHKTGDIRNEAIVLLHGNNSDSQTFQQSIGRLSERFYVVTYDQRGLGKTSYEGVDFSLPAMIADLKAVVDSLPASKVHLVGHSFGARIAVGFAAEYPNRTASVMIEDMEMRARQTFTPQECSDLGLQMQALNRVYPSIEAMQAALRTYYKDDTDSLKKISTENLPGGEVRLITNPYVPYVWGCFANSLDLNPALTKFSAPLLILRAEPKMSAISNLGLAEMLAQRPTARLVNFAGSHHSIHRYSPDRFVYEIRDFLRSASGRAL